MILETERIKLIPPAYTYLDKLFEVHHDPLNQKYNPAGPVETVEELKKTLSGWIKHYQDHGFGYYVLIKKDHYQPFGICGLQYKNIKGQTYLNIYYRIEAAQTRQGLVAEASRKVIEHVKEITENQYKIVALTKRENIPSIKTAEALGLKYQPEFDDYDGEGNVYYFSE
ncbi:GNAT family N-acetyltransferase [Mammaliicoccus vitulinus]|uniref:GNAT family N-acetyltransferase n=1 Tax=Mammaliicoccus vitulinus TaxID=71237 RepID=A0ABX7HFP3_9STAP|nr:GNAT family protein [Mammaliicoccus vitulinus]MBO3076408.1 GNAT family N-acetyltransferase [Mammaliicoccus vitulinus]MEB7657661.1 GNAT family N-acetyltransferase [Mammaliicoccus vitulinus]PNZ35446.1 N-acetyltransferase [Mammaliicoccus vitulinus]PTI86149.1 N-acetyltransferase [Mammaliicoccus vitulinus]QJF24535.1 GNAT family N-acetyltransferase [Mammaliicoccus vitulinus]